MQTTGTLVHEGESCCNSRRHPGDDGGQRHRPPYSAIQSRFKGVRYTNSNIFYEIGMSVGSILLIPIAMLHHGVRLIVGKA